MSTTATTSFPALTAAPAPKFFGIVQAEIFKMLHQRINWLMLLSVFGFVLLPWLILPITPAAKTSLQTDTYYTVAETLRICAHVAHQGLLKTCFLTVAEAKTVRTDRG